MELDENRESVTSVTTAGELPIAVSSNSNYLASTSSGENTIEPDRIALRVPEDCNGPASLAPRPVLPIGSAAPSSPFPSPTLVQQALVTSPELLFSLSPEELDHAKTLVLDLLGWGVDPEYLIESGVSAEVIFRVFTDLNLCLPKNLVVSEKLEDIAYSWGPRPSESPQNN